MKSKREAAGGGVRTCKGGGCVCEFDSRLAEPQSGERKTNVYRESNDVFHLVERECNRLRFPSSLTYTYVHPI